MLPSNFVKAKCCTFSRHNLDILLRKANKMFAEYVPVNLNNFFAENLHDDATVAREICKEIKHPSYEAFKNLFKPDIPLTSTILMLTSKAAGVTDKTIDKTIDEKTGLLVKQQLLGESMEMFSTGNLLHRDIQSLEGLIGPNKTQVIQCNTWCALFGLRMYAAGTMCLGQIRNNEVYELIMSSVRDLSEAQFIGKWDEIQNAPLPKKPRLFVTSSHYIGLENPGLRVIDPNNWLGSALDEWTCRNLLNGSSLLAKCCKASIKLAGHDRQTQESVYVLGRNILLMHQLSVEICEITTNNNNNDKFSMVSAPILYHLEYDNKFYNTMHFELNSLEKIDYKTIKEVVLNGPGIDKALGLKKALFEETMEVLERFQKNPYTNILCEIVHSI